MLKQRNWAESSKKYVIKKDKNELLRMYPKIDYDGKYLLWMEISFMWKYPYNDIKANIHVYRNDGSEFNPIQYKVRRIYPNKYYHTICMKNSHKLCDKGVVLVFDSFEQISNISHIDYTWTIQCDNKEKYLGVFRYKLDFVYEMGKNIYGMIIHDTDLMTIEEEIKKNDGLYKDKLNEYENVFIIKQNPNEKRCSLQVLKDSLKNTGQNSIEALSIYHNKVANQKNNLISNDCYRIECFFTQEKLIPDICSPA